MKIPEFGSLQMIGTQEAHYAHQKLLNTVDAGKVLNAGIENSAKTGIEKSHVTFENYLIDAVKSMNRDQVNLGALQQKLVTEPDEVDIHDVTIAMGKARMSLNLAQTVIDRLVQGWNEITTTR